MAGDPTEEYLRAVAAAEASGGPIPTGPSRAEMDAFLAQQNPLGGGVHQMFPEGWRSGMPFEQIGGVPSLTEPSLTPIPQGPGNVRFAGPGGGPLSPGRLSGGASVSGPLGDLKGLAKKASGLELDIDDESFRTAIEGYQIGREGQLNEYGEKVGAQLEQSKKTQLTLQTMAQRQEHAHTQIKANYADAKLALQYWNTGKTPAELRRLVEIRDTGKTTDADGLEAYATPEERKKAANVLAKSEDIDPKRALRGWRGIVGALATALGELGSAMTGRPNRVIDVIQSKIDNDIAAQRMEYEAKRANLGDTFNAYSMFRQMGQDEREAVRSADAFAWENVARLGTMMGIKEEYLGLGVKAQKALMDAGQQRFTNDLNKIKTEADIAQSRGALSVSNRQLDLAAGKKPDSVQATLPLAVQELRELIAMRKEYGSETIPGETKSTMESKAASLLFDIAKLAEQGALQKADRDVAEEALGSATGYGFQLAKMEALLKRWERKAAGEGVTVGGEGGRPVE